MNEYFSMPLFKENTKRFWGFSAAAFLFYFLSSSFPIMLMHDELQNHASFVQSCVSVSYIPYTLLDLCVAAIASVVVFRYLSKVNSTGVIHAMPFSRKNLFITNYISGLFLAIMPVVLNGIVLFLLKTPVMRGIAAPENGGEIVSYDVFTSSAILKSLLLNILIIFFTYAISSLAAVICGNSIIHLCTCAALNFIVPVTIISFQAYRFLFLFGYNSDDRIISAAIKMHPALYTYRGTIFGQGYSSSFYLTLIIYVVVSLLISILAFRLYSIRKLERAEESYVFTKIKYFIGFCFMYYPATVVGFLVYEEWGNISGFIIGGIIGFVIGWMIVCKSFRIVNKKSLKPFLIACSGTLVIALALSFDLFGYTKRIPNTDDVESVNINIYADDALEFEEVKDISNINSIRGLHDGIIKWHLEDENDYDDFASVYITYNLKNGKQLKRSYEGIPFEVGMNAKYVKPIFESEECKTVIDTLKIYKQHGTELCVSDSFSWRGEDNDLTLFGFESSEIDDIKNEIIDALILDLKERSFEEFIDQRYAYGEIRLFCPGTSEHVDNYYINSYPDGYSDGQPRLYNMHSGIGFNDYYEHLISVLEKYGLMEATLPKGSISYLVVSQYDTKEDWYGDYTVAVEPIEALPSNMPEPREPIVKIDDKCYVNDTALQQLIVRNNAYDFPHRLNNPLRVQLYTCDDNAKWEESVEYGHAATFYSEFDSLPDGIKELMK